MNWLIDELYRMFIGDSFAWHHLLEIMFRTAFMYMYTIGNVRLMDKRSMGMLSPFEIIIVIALGSAVGDPMYDTKLPLLYGMIVISTIVFIERLIAKGSMWSPFFERLINGMPVLIIKDGKLLKDAMTQQNISRDEINSMLRMRGVLHIADVDRAYLEPSGSVSIIRKDGIIGSDTIPEYRLKI